MKKLYLDVRTDSIVSVKDVVLKDNMFCEVWDVLQNFTYWVEVYHLRLLDDSIVAMLTKKD